jgi:hypothetical protein
MVLVAQSSRAVEGWGSCIRMCRAEKVAEKFIGTVILRSRQAVLSSAKEESRIVLKTLRARSFAAAQDDSMGAFFRSLLYLLSDFGDRQVTADFPGQQV